MRVSRFAACVPLVLFVCFCSVRAQEPVTLSPILTLDYGSPLFLSRQPSILNANPEVLSGTSSRFSFGLGAEVALEHIIAEHFGLATGLHAISSSGKFQADGGGGIIMGRDLTIELDPSLLWSNSEFIARAGPWVSSRISGSVFLNGSDVTSPNTLSPAIHLGIEAGIGSFIPGVPIEPELTTHLDLTEFGKAGTNAWSVGLAFAYRFNRKPSIELTPQAPQAERVREPEPATPLAPGRVRFLVNGEEPRGNVLLQRAEIRKKQYTTLSTAIAVHPDQQLASVVHLLSVSEAAKFSASSLVDIPIDSIRRESINIFAYRLTQNPSAHITFALPYGVDSSLLIREFANYFDSVWHVSSARVKFTRATIADGLQDIRVSASNPNILAPLVTQWVVQSFHLPHLAITSEIDRDATGNVILTHGVNLLVRYPDLHSNASVLTFDTVIDLDRDRRWQEGILGLKVFEQNPIVATLTQLDNTGRTSTYRDTLLLPPLDDTGQSGGTFVRKQYRFYFDPADTAEDGLRAQDLLLERLASLLEPGARITIIEGRHKTFSAPNMMEARILDKLREVAHKPQIQRGSPGDEQFEDGAMVIVEL